MRIGHISDCHLGYSAYNKMKDENTGLNIREQDGYNAFKEVIDIIIKERPDVVVCTGDMFHTPTPSMYTIRFAQEQLERLVEAEIPFYNLTGNHDTTDNVKSVPASRVLHQPLLHLYSHTEPYIVEPLGENIYLHLISHHAYVEQEKTFEEVKLIEGAVNILCTHGSVFDEEIDDILHTENSPREVVISEKLANMPWDYILLGHIHKRGWVGSKDGLTDTAKKKRFYAGSLIRRGFSDEECKLGRGLTIWSIDEKTKEITPTFYIVAQRPQYDFVVQCKNKKTENIEKEIFKCFEDIKDIELPIVRLQLLNPTKKEKMVFNNKRFAEYAENFLSFTIKIVSKEENDVGVSITNDNTNMDLLKAFDLYWEEAKKEYKEEKEAEAVKKISDILLKRGIEKILDKV